MAVKKMVQIMPWPEGWEAVFFSYDDGELFCEPVLFWASVSETPYVGRKSWSYPLRLAPYDLRQEVYAMRYAIS